MTKVRRRWTVMFSINVTLLLHLLAIDYKWGKGYIKISILDIKMVGTFHISSNVMRLHYTSELEASPSKIRRCLFHVAGYSSFIKTTNEISWASTPTDVGEAIRYSASKIPMDMVPPIFIILSHGKDNGMYEGKYYCLDR